MLEMARQLVADNEQIGILVLFDSAGPGYPRKRPWHERIGAHLKHMRKLTAHQQLAYPLVKLRGKIAPAATDLATMLGITPRTRDTEPPAVRALKQARAAYTARVAPHAGAATLLRATEHFDYPGVCFDDPYNGWNSVFQGGIEVHPIRGSHHTMFQEPGLTELATTLQSCLRRAYARYAG